ncbi:hypothetical protein [Actinomadura sp. WMMA1423]|uniref:hypothetical protein n=1 Tax=Actinomadura sp. WMMA1423 TaxID=2591108 RepID=UPI001146A780|nr:hypothetical protein [Actinomadura sp. WMMA1423]
MKSFSYSDLDKLTGEVLPERAVLSTLLAGGGGNSNGNENGNFNLNHGGGSTGTTAVVPLCQSTVSSHEGILGVLNADNESHFVCSSAAVVSGH